MGAWIKGNPAPLALLESALVRLLVMCRICIPTHKQQQTCMPVAMLCGSWQQRKHASVVLGVCGNLQLSTTDLNRMSARKAVHGAGNMVFVPPHKVPCLACRHRVLEGGHRRVDFCSTTVTAMCAECGFLCMRCGRQRQPCDGSTLECCVCDAQASSGTPCCRWACPLAQSSCTAGATQGGVWTSSLRGWTYMQLAAAHVRPSNAACT
jgi:hypothetical protein